MTRRKITDEAQDNSDDDTDNEQSNSSNEGRHTLTQRMPNDMVEEVDEFADRRGMSRNAAINFLVREALDGT
jgi:hypothetical protein